MSQPGTGGSDMHILTILTGVTALASVATTWAELYTQGGL